MSNLLKRLAERAPEVALQIRGAAVAPPTAVAVFAVPEGADLLYRYGAGQIEDYQKVRKWLRADPSHTLAIVDEEPSSWQRWLPGAGLLLDDPQVVFYHIGDEEHLFQELFATYPGRKAAFSAHPTTGPERANQLMRRLIEASATAGRLIDEFQSHCDLFFRNFYKNLGQMDGAIWGASLFDQFKGVPAIICGAGPSLDRNFDLLATLKDRALIFAGGSALNAVSAGGLIPHFGAGIDPHHYQWQRLMSNAAFELPFFYRNRWDPDALELFHGRPLYLNGAGGQPIARWFEEGLGIEAPELDAGQNVVNFTVEIARALGCNPILFVGLDLAYSDELQYADGVVPDRSLDPDDDHYYDALVRQNGVLTHWKWIAEAEWIGNYPKRYPVDLYNCTEGGLGFPGVADLTLAEGVERFLTKIYPLDDQVHAAIEGAPRIDASKIPELLHLLRASLERCQIMLERLMVRPTALDEVELEEEVAYKPCLSAASYVWRSQLPVGPELYRHLAQVVSIHLEAIDG